MTNNNQYEPTPLIKGGQSRTPRQLMQDSNNTALALLIAVAVILGVLLLWALGVMT